MNPRQIVQTVSSEAVVLISEARDKEGRVVGHKVAKFVPGMVITRCGREYRVEKDGSQRRIKRGQS